MIKKNLLQLLFPLLIVALFFPTNERASADELVKVFIDREYQYFDEQPPIVKNNRTLVPMRQIFEALGATIDWDGKTNTITAKKNQTTVQLKVNSKSATINEKITQLDVPAYMQNNRTFVPLRFVAEAFNAKITWEDTTHIVFITSASTEDEKILNQLFESEMSTLYILHEQISSELFEGKKEPFSKIEQKLKKYYTDNFIKSFWQPFYSSEYFTEWYTHTDYLFDFLINEPYLSETQAYTIEKLDENHINFSILDDPRVNEGPMSVELSEHTYKLIKTGNDWLIDSIH